MNKEKKNVNKLYIKPILTKYRPKNESIQEYQTSGGVTNSIKCTNPDLCSGGEGASLPQWLLP